MLELRGLRAGEDCEGTRDNGNCRRLGELGSDRPDLCKLVSGNAARVSTVCTGETYAILPAILLEEGSEVLQSL